MSVHRARGAGKNLILTLWLLLPFVVVGGLVAGIFVAYGRGGPAMRARPVGQGAGDTGGANALGELLAGNDPDERQRVRREARAGRLIDPLAWPGGIRVEIELASGDRGAVCVVVWGGQGAGTAALVRPLEPSPGGVASAVVTLAEIAAALAEGRTGAGLYLACGDAASEVDGVLVDGEGNPLRRLEIETFVEPPADRAEPCVVRAVGSPCPG